MSYPNLNGTLLHNNTKEYTALAVEIMYFKEMKHSSGLHSLRLPSLSTYMLPTSMT